MKILYIAPKNPIPPNEGGKIAILGNVKYLNSRDHIIDFVYYSNKSDASNNELQKYTNSIIPVKYSTSNSILGIIKNLFSPVPYNISKYHSYKMKSAVINALQKNNYDIVFIENLHMGFLVDDIKNKFHIPVLLRQHNVEMKIMKRFFESQKSSLLRFYSKLQYKKFLKYEPNLCSKFDEVVMITKKDEDDLLELNTKIKTTVIPAGVEKSLLSIQQKVKEPYSIFHIGKLDWFPNIDALRFFINDVLPFLVKKQPKIKFYIYGGKLPENFDIPEEVKNHIIQKGYVDNLWTDIADKQLAVIPLRIGSGMRLKIVELLAAGHNILTTSIGCEGINVEDEKHLLIANQKEEFAIKVIDFFNGKFDSEQMIRNGRTLIEEQYLWEKIAERFEQTFEKLVSENKNK